MDKILDFLVKPKSFMKLSFVDLLLVPFMYCLISPNPPVLLFIIADIFLGVNFIIRLLALNRFKDKYPRDILLSLKSSMVLIVILIIISFFYIK